MEIGIVELVAEAMVEADRARPFSFSLRSSCVQRSDLPE
jgi:hypothetical protein